MAIILGILALGFIGLLFLACVIQTIMIAAVAIYGLIKALMD